MLASLSSPKLSRIARFGARVSRGCNFGPAVRFGVAGGISLQQAIFCVSSRVAPKLRETAA
jgi:hypothetical protein